MTYKDKFRQRLAAAQPKEILDVGCGEGALLQYCEALGISAIGVDPDQDAIAECQRKGLRAICGGAEHLDLPDNSVDFVASEFSLHHYASLSGFLREAIRVARKGIFCLDAWYDLSIPSQRCASDFDRWMKRIDRAAGDVHHDVYNIDQILDALPESDAGQELEAEYWLDLRPLPPEKLARLKSISLAKSDDSGSMQDAYLEIEASIKQHGISEDGAIFFQLT